MMDIYILPIMALVNGLIQGISDSKKGGAISENEEAKILEEEVTIIPNQGIRKSIANTWLVELIGGLIGALIGGLIGELIGGLYVGLFVGLTVGLFGGGGQASIQHLTLRLILYSRGLIPWNYARFLDYATDRIFLQKVGGGYIFIHRLLLEHFAQMELEQVRR
jgi:hypothetical protein